jgi:hypothetical protein
MYCESFSVSKWRRGLSPDRLCSGLFPEYYPDNGPHHKILPVRSFSQNDDVAGAVGINLTAAVQSRSPEPVYSGLASPKKELLSLRMRETRMSFCSFFENVPRKNTPFSHFRRSLVPQVTDLDIWFLPFIRPLMKGGITIRRSFSSGLRRSDYGADLAMAVSVPVSGST